MEPRSIASVPRGRPPLATTVGTVVCALGAILGWWLAPSEAARTANVLAYIAGGTAATATALMELTRWRLSVDLLMILAAVGAAILGDWTEGSILLFLFSLSGTLEAYAMYRTTRSIDSLIQLRPREAFRLRAGEESLVAIDELEVGDLVRVRPGERFPVDGEVVEGESWADEATLTGESIPVAKRSGDEVFAGTINGQGSVLARMTRGVADSTLERIIRRVREAQAEKTGTQRFVESWEQPYVFLVIAGSALVFLISWWLLDREAEHSFYHAMVVMVVASPCAVVVGSPAVMLSAIARAARHGVLFKGARSLETLGRADLIAFDKTGTITVGKPRVVEVWTHVAPGDDPAPGELLRLAAAVEAQSEHPLGAAITDEARRQGLNVAAVGQFASRPGLGVKGLVDGRWVYLGRESYFHDEGVELPRAVRDELGRARAQGRTAIPVLTERGEAGVISVADVPREGVTAALARLKRLGIRKIVLLTGDHDLVAGVVGELVQADEVCANLLPEDKVEELRRLRSEAVAVVMVGDGVNDAPALASADVGVAMGGAGTDVALEVADVVLMRDDLNALAFAVWLGREARSRVRQNLYFAFGMIAVLLGLSCFNLPLWVGVLGHEGSTVIVVLNGLRLLWQGDLDDEVASARTTPPVREVASRAQPVTG